MHEKMKYIREYARGRLKEGERLWWRGTPMENHTHYQYRLDFTKLSLAEKTKLEQKQFYFAPE